MSPSATGYRSRRAHQTSRKSSRLCPQGRLARASDPADAAEAKADLYVTLLVTDRLCYLEGTAAHSLEACLSLAADNELRPFDGQDLRIVALRREIIDLAGGSKR